MAHNKTFMEMFRTMYKPFSLMLVHLNRHFFDDAFALRGSSRIDFFTKYVNPPTPYPKTSNRKKLT